MRLLGRPKRVWEVTGTNAREWVYEMKAREWVYEMKAREWVYEMKAREWVCEIVESD